MWGSEKQKKADIGRFSGKTTIIAQDAEVIGDLRFVGAVQVDGLELAVADGQAGGARLEGRNQRRHGAPVGRRPDRQLLGRGAPRASHDCQAGQKQREKAREGVRSWYLHAPPRSDEGAGAGRMVRASARPAARTRRKA